MPTRDETAREVADQQAIADNITEKIVDYCATTEKDGWAHGICSFVLMAMADAGKNEYAEGLRAELAELRHKLLTALEDAAMWKRQLEKEQPDVPRNSGD